jgi:hypothetical protein
MAKSTYYVGPHYGFFSIFVLLHPSWVQMFLASCSQTHNICALPLCQVTEFHAHVNEVTSFRTHWNLSLFFMTYEEHQNWRQSITVSFLTPLQSSEWALDRYCMRQFVWWDRPPFRSQTRRFTRGDGLHWSERTVGRAGGVGRTIPRCGITRILNRTHGCTHKWRSLRTSGNTVTDVEP